MIDIKVKVVCATCLDTYEIADMGPMVHDGGIVIPVIPGHECKASKVEADPDFCDACKDTGHINMGGHTMPCTFCNRNR